MCSEKQPNITWKLGGFVLWDSTLSHKQIQAVYEHGKIATSVERERERERDVTLNHKQIQATVAAHMLVTKFFSRAILVYFSL